jgi:hypothetical protein
MGKINKYKKYSLNFIRKPIPKIRQYRSSSMQHVGLGELDQQIGDSPVFLEQILNL